MNNFVVTNKTFGVEKAPVVYDRKEKMFLYQHQYINKYHYLNIIRNRYGEFSGYYDFILKFNPDEHVFNPKCFDWERNFDYIYNYLPEYEKQLDDFFKYEIPNRHKKTERLVLYVGLIGNSWLYLGLYPTIGLIIACKIARKFWKKKKRKK